MATLYFNGAVDGDWNNLSNWWDDSGFTTPASALPTSSDSVVASATISSNGGSAPTVVNFTINGSNQYLGITLTVTGIATFNDTTYNVGNITGEVEFNDSSANGQLGSIIGNVTFNDNSIHAPSANINENATFNDNSIKRGSVTGTITWNSSYPSDGSLTYYFNGATDGDWNNIGNWWLDSGFSVPVTSTLIGLPQSIDSVIASANITSNSGSTPTVKNFTITDAEMRTNSNITNSAIFNGSSILAVPSGSIQMNMTDASATITFNNNSVHNGGINVLSNGGTGSVIFNDSSYINTGNISANTTFNDNSALGVSGNITGDATFNDSSIKRGTVTGTITWSSSYPNDYSLTYYYNNGSTDGDWATLGNWWLDSSFTVPINSGIGLPTNIDTTNIFANVSSNTGSTPTVKNLYVGDNSYANVSFDISINVNNSATFNNGAKFAYGSNKSLLLNENKTVTFNSNSDCYGTIDCVDGTSLVNIVFNNCGNIGAAFEPYGQLNGNLTLNDSSMTIGTYTIGSTGVLTLNGTSAESGFLSNHSSAAGTTVLNNKTVILNNDTTLGLTALVNLCNVTFNGTSDTYRSTYFTNCTLTFNDNSVYVSDGVGVGAEQGGAANNIYYFNDNSFNYGFIATTVNGITYGNSTVNINLAKGINGSSILGIV